MVWQLRMQSCVSAVPQVLLRCWDHSKTWEWCVCVSWRRQSNHDAVVTQGLLTLGGAHWPQGGSQPPPPVGLSTAWNSNWSALSVFENFWKCSLITDRSNFKQQRSLRASWTLPEAFATQPNPPSGKLKAPESPQHSYYSHAIRASISGPLSLKWPSSSSYGG